MSGAHYAVSRVDEHKGSYYMGRSDYNPFGYNSVKNEDVMLHQALSKIFRERCLTSGQKKELLRASEQTDQELLIQRILQLEPGLSKIFRKGSELASLLWIAVLSCYQDSAELLVCSGADVNEPCEIKFSSGFFDKEWTILHVLIDMYPSSWNGRFIGMVMDHGADLEIRDSYGYTVLHYAVRRGRLKVAKMLLEKEADVNAAANNRMTPLLTATHGISRVDELMSLLLKHGADVTLRDADGQNVLHHLADIRVERARQAKVLIEKGAALDVRTYTKLYQPLHIAARAGKLKLIKVFLDHGANVNARADGGEFPLLRAAECNDPDVLFTLIARGAKADLKEYRGRTALHTACEKLKVEMIKVLCFFGGADVSVEDYDGNTPFSLMHTSDHSDSSVRLVLRLLALKKTRQQPSIELKDERRIKEEPERWNYYRDCFEEIDRMRSARFIETCSFFELMTICQCQIAVLLRNREFGRKFQQQDLSVFPKYADDMLSALDAGQDYYSRVLKQEDLIDEAFYNTWPHIIVRKVARYALGCRECDVKEGM